MLIIITKLKVTISAKYTPKDQDIKVKLSAWFGLIRYTINIPLVKIDDDSAAVVVKHKEKSNLGNESANKQTDKFSAKTILNGMKDMQTLIEHVVNLHKIIQKFLRKVTISELKWHTSFGLGDAAHTGIFVGVGWSIKGCLLGILSKYMILKAKPVMSITPLFQQLHSESKIKCIIQFRVGNAMLAGIRLVRFWRGGKPKFRTTPLSMLTGNAKKSAKS